jgi:hypothetical protein
MTVLNPTASIWAVATRICALDVEGYPDPGNAMYVTEQMLKTGLTPVMETGDDVVQKNASGNLSAWAKHADMVKYGTISLELAIPDPALEALCTGATLLGSSAAALGEPSGLTVTAQTTLGELAAGTYGYRVSQHNSFGESLALTDVSAKVSTGTTGLVAIYAKPVAGALGLRVYGRTIGVEQYLGTIPNIGEPETSAAIKVETPTAIPVAALTKSIPKGTKFQIEGDTTSPKIVFTTTAFCPVGVVTVPVEASGEVKTEIATKKKLLAVFLDTGAITPSGNLPQEDQTAGPGENTGVNASELGVVGNENGVSIEVFAKAIEHGRQANKLPFIHWILPRVQGMHIQPRDLTNANAATILEGQAYENPNWGTGPVGDWPSASTRWYGRLRCGRAVVPKASFENTPATV